MMENVSHIEIDGGTISGPTVIETATGKRTLPTLIGSYRYFVSVIEGDGGRICMWDGADYVDALNEAAVLKASFNAGRIVDMTGRAA
jgi:hypothetical protein